MKKLLLSLLLVAVSASAQISNPSNVGPGGRPPTFTSHGVLVGQAAANVVATPAGTSGQCLISGGPSADPAWGSCAAGGAGTVTTISVVSANGLAGTVANPTTTPAITLSTSISGILKGNATAISAASSGTDYSLGTSALGTGIVKTTTGTGALTVAVAGDFPTLNQNTSGTAANVTGIVGVANGGTALSGTPTNGQIPIGNGTNYTLATISAGSGITITNSPGSVSIAASGSAAGMVLLTSITPTAALNADALTAFSATYDNYLIIADGIRPAVDDTLRMRFGNAGTADAGSNYLSAGTSGGNYPAAATSNAPCSFTMNVGLGCSFRVELENVNSTTAMKSGWLRSSSQSAAAPTYTANFTNIAYIASNAISGVRFFWSGGSNFVATGTIKIYGYNN